MKLKQFRTTASLVFFLLILLSFLPFSWLRPSLTPLAELQFVPALLRAVHYPTSLAAAVLCLLLLLTFIFGRVYCSFLCPLGVLQDIVIYLARHSGRNQLRFRPPVAVLRWSLLAAVVFSITLSSLVMINLLDPYAVFGRLTGDLLLPAMVRVHNNAAALLEHWELYYVWPITAPVRSWPLLLVSLLVLLLIIALARSRGRLLCNSLCPVGSLLGLCSRFSFYRPQISQAQCTACRRCEITCKAECINSREQTIDYSRCVACFNCLAACPQGGITYRCRTEAAPLPVDPLRRAVIFRAASAGTLLVLSAAGLRSFFSLPRESQVRVPITPPGSRGVEHFTARCIGCQLCVSTCPSGIITPSLLSYGTQGIMQPQLNYRAGHCEYHCTACSQVCPTGAIERISLEEKERIQIGQAHYVEDHCVVKLQGKECGACAEVCPTLAVRMVKRSGLFFPELNARLCVGCGHCQMVCPAHPKAFYVSGNYLHLTAEKPEQILPVTADRKEENTGFPF